MRCDNEFVRWHLLSNPLVLDAGSDVDVAASCHLMDLPSPPQSPSSNKGLMSWHVAGELSWPCKEHLWKDISRDIAAAWLLSCDNKMLAGTEDIPCP